MALNSAFEQQVTGAARSSAEAVLPPCHYLRLGLTEKKRRLSATVTPQTYVCVMTRSQVSPVRLCFSTPNSEDNWSRSSQAPQS
jgi:hypothetical protein